MKIRITALIFLLAMLLTGCGCEHEWADATCLASKTCKRCQETEGEALGHIWADATCAEPKTCTACGETEGEALPHTWMEANYQEPKMCTECGTADGKPLPADFEMHGLSYNMQEKWQYTYVTSCHDKLSEKTKGSLYVYNYRIFESDESHPLKEGYEWRAVDVQIHFFDANAQYYGMRVRSALENFYDIEGWDDSSNTTDEGVVEYMVNYHGVEYPVTADREEAGYSEWTESGRCTYSASYFFQVPVGYDGVVLGFYDASTEWEDGMYIYDIADENTLFFRLA